MIKGEKLYLVWQDGEDEQYYEQYESLEDAVTSRDEPVQVYEATVKSIGAYEVLPTKIKLKKVKGSK